MCSWHSLQLLAGTSSLRLTPPPSTNLREFYVPEELCVRVALHKHPFNLRCILEQLLRVLCNSNFPYLQVLSLSPRLVLTVVHPVPAFVGGLP